MQMSSSLILFSFQENHYRPVGSDICYPCNCYKKGSFHQKCNPTTGACPCKEGVIGRTCDTCYSKFAEVTLRGCEGKELNPESAIPSIESVQFQVNVYLQLY